LECPAILPSENSTPVSFSLLLAANRIKFRESVAAGSWILVS
jgi:hypothetical protein